MPSPRLGRPRKGEAALRRDLLLDEALRLFAEHGYSAVSLETLARCAHVSLRTIYRQFGGKAQLFGAVVRRISDEFVARLPADVDCPLDAALEKFGQQFLRRILRPEVLKLRAQILAEGGRFPELAAEFYRNGPGRTLARLEEFLSAHQRVGHLSKSMEARSLAGHFLNLLRGPINEFELGMRAPPSEEELRAWVEQAVAVFLRGCQGYALD
ncbi:TetR/AcrR family transcriptional regulator [Methylothermus subterraneus]